MKDLRQFIKTTIREFLNESSDNDSNLILYHGSNNRKIYNKFYD